ncbi:MAG: cell division protein FtsA, partial [Gammaproteobacteria bacterium]|nr:cell division protein FtsA [Gammaproteobacteria bacterium]
MRANRQNFEDRTIVGLDIGTAIVTFVVCTQHDEGIEVIGIGDSPTAGMQRGMVSNIEALVESIESAKAKASSMCMREIDRVI